jgi:hypothetical protein
MNKSITVLLTSIGVLVLFGGTGKRRHTRSAGRVGVLGGRLGRASKWPQQQTRGTWCAGRMGHGIGAGRSCPGRYGITF